MKGNHLENWIAYDIPYLINFSSNSSLASIKKAFVNSHILEAQTLFLYKYSCYYAANKIGAIEVIVKSFDIWIPPPTNNIFIVYHRHFMIFVAWNIYIYQLHMKQVSFYAFLAMTSHVYLENCIFDLHNKREILFCFFFSLSREKIMGS